MIDPALRPIGPAARGTGDDRRLALDERSMRVLELVLAGMALAASVLLATFR